MQRKWRCLCSIHLAAPGEIPVAAFLWGVCEPPLAGRVCGHGDLELGCDVHSGYSQTMDNTGSDGSTRSVRVILVGDSTMATRTGYETRSASASSKASSASTQGVAAKSKSFSRGRLWDNVQKILANNRASDKPRATVPYSSSSVTTIGRPGKPERSHRSGD